MTTTALSTSTGRAEHPGRTRVLWVACGAHALHDGLTDTLYLLLPLWQAQFALSYAAIGILRALYTGVMAGFQVPTAKLAQRTGGARMLAGGTAVAAVAYLLLGASSSVALLAVALVLGGIGSSTQHPIASSLVAVAYEGPRSRGALGTYNFAGAVGVIGLLGAGAILLSLRAVTSATVVRTPIRPEQGKAADWTKLLRNGFPLLLTIGVIDSATRMGFLTFLPFLLQSKGAGLSEIGLALTMVFAGGAAGKLVCGFLGARLGVLPTVLITEGATAVGILALLPLPIGATLALLPLIGVALNGTSSVLYGTVPDLAPADRRESAFGVFYTGTIGAGALSPVLYGLISDVIDLTPAMLLVAAIVLLTLPLAWKLTRVLSAIAQDLRSQTAREVL